MNIVAFSPLHYGADYLGYAIRSVIDDVDAFYVLYTPHSSYGWKTHVPIPERENRDNLHAIALAAAGDKLHWHDGRWSSFGDHNDAIMDIAPDADIVVTVDSDEIWQTGMLKFAIDETIDKPEMEWRLPMVHYWRSFRWAVLHDPAYPIRIRYPRRKPGTSGYVRRHSEGMVINHMGYATKEDVCWYKIQVHGHRGEFRTDCNWYHDKFLANVKDDVHIVGSEYWFPREVDPLVYLPEWMQAHPFWNEDVIK